MDNLRELCEGYNFNNLSYWRNIPSSKAATIRNYLGINDEEPILFYDSTLFSSGKNGLAVCDSGIYWKDMLVPAKYLSWKSLRSLKITRTNSLIHFGEDLSFGALGSDTDHLYTMLTTLRVNAKIDNIVQKTTGFLGFLDKAANFLSELDSSLKETQTDSLQTNAQNALDSPKYVEASKITVNHEPSLWTIACKGSTFGPYTETEVKNWLKSHKDEQDKIYVWKKGMSNWEPIEDISEFSSYFNTLSELPPLPNF